MDKKILYKNALHKWGIKLQLEILVEECIELSYATLKFIRHGNLHDILIVGIFDDVLLERIFDEIADVEIMIEQFKQMFGESRIEQIKEQKLIRLKDLIEQNGL